MPLEKKNRNRLVQASKLQAGLKRSHAGAIRSSNIQVGSSHFKRTALSYQGVASTQVNIDDIKNKFEDYIIIHNDNDIWKDIDEISNIIHIDKSFVKHNIDNLRGFIKNRDGEYTTVRLYEENTSFLKKMRDQFFNEYE